MALVLDIFADGARTRHRIVGDINLAHEAYAPVRLGILYEVFKHSHATGPASDTVVRAYRHHASAMGAFLIQHVELAFQVG